MSQPIPKCGNCLWFGVDPDWRLGHCNEPAQVEAFGSQHVGRDDLCGEHEFKEPEPLPAGLTNEGLLLWSKARLVQAQADGNQGEVFVWEKQIRGLEGAIS